MHARNVSACSPPLCLRSPSLAHSLSVSLSFSLSYSRRRDSQDVDAALLIFWMVLSFITLFLIMQCCASIYIQYKVSNHSENKERGHNASVLGWRSSKGKLNANTKPKS